MKAGDRESVNREGRDVNVRIKDCIFIDQD